MKKIINRLIIVILVLSNIILLYNIYDLKKEVLSYKENYKKSKKNMISMMLETDTNSKTYIQSTDSTWPSDGYMFNVEMSKCEQGSKLSWDDTNKKVVMEGNSSDKCYVFFDKYSPITINNYSITSSGNKITITIDASSGTGTISKYYYSKDDGETYIESTSNNYVFTSLDKGTYKIKAYVEDSNGKKTEIIFKNVEIYGPALSEYIISKYTGTQGANGIYYHDLTLSAGAKDNNYRYYGANPNNYVCFGSDEETCSEDNLYRIIGVYNYNAHGNVGKNLVKVIKKTSYGKLQWNSTSSRKWESATLNTTLNTTFLSEKLSNYKEKIATVTWKVSGYNDSKQTVQVLFTNEITNATSEYTSKVALMYASDYGFATPSNYWSTNLYDYDDRAYKYDWLFDSAGDQWTLTPVLYSQNGAWGIFDFGRVGDAGGVTNSYIVRPVFYLDESVSYISGDGSQNLPYRVK